MDDPSDWNRLDAAAFRVSVKRSVRRLGWACALIGAVVLVCGIAASFPPMIVAGSVLACAGAWNARRPSVTGLLVDGATVLMLGVFSALAWRWMGDLRESSIMKAIVAGLVQIVWGLRGLAFYRTARFTPNDARAITRLEAIVGELSRGDATSESTIVEFRNGPFRRHRNRLGLYEEGVVGLLAHRAVRLEKRADIWIEAGGTTTLGRTVKVRIQMSDLELDGWMSPDHFERFERWKLGMSRPRPIAA